MKKELKIRDNSTGPDDIDTMTVEHSHNHIWLFSLEKYGKAENCHQFIIRDEDAEKLLGLLKEVYEDKTA